MPAPAAWLVSLRGASPPWAAPALRGSRRGSLSPARLPWSGLPAVRPVLRLRCFGCVVPCVSPFGPEALTGATPGPPRPLGRSESMAEAVLCGGESVGAQWIAGLVVMYVPTERRRIQHG